MQKKFYLNQTNCPQLFDLLHSSCCKNSNKNSMNWIKAWIVCFFVYFDWEMNISTATEKHFGRHNDWGLVFFDVVISVVDKHTEFSTNLNETLALQYDKLQFEVLHMFNGYTMSWPWQMLNFRVTITTGIQNQFSLQNSTMSHEICAQWKYAANKIRRQIPKT